VRLTSTSLSTSRTADNFKFFFGGKFIMNFNQKTQKMQKEKATTSSPLSCGLNGLKCFSRNDEAVVPPDSSLAVLLGVTKKFITKFANNPNFPTLCLPDFQRETTGQSERHMIAIRAREFFRLAVFAWPKPSLDRILPEMEENAIFLFGSRAGLAGQSSENLHRSNSGIHTRIWSFYESALLPNSILLHCVPPTFERCGLNLCELIKVCLMNQW
jgi:hypothetical protein